MTAYDEVAYPTWCHPQLHPDRLGTPAVLRGLDAAPAEACRYLELGCGDGGTTLGLAQALPGGTFVGVDLATTAIARGEEARQAAGLDNAALHVGDLTDLSALELGTFDYVVCHGVFSWVPTDVRDGILRALKDHLAPNGVAYLSYNCNPAGLLRELSRQMLRFHLQGRDQSPEDLLDEGRQLLGFLAQNRPEGDWWRGVLEHELGHLERRLPQSFVHDELAPINQPFWFQEVVGLAAGHRLRFLAEADDTGGGESLWPPGARDLLTELGDEPERREQYLDLLVGRRFRQTLFCHDDVLLDRPPPVSRVAKLHVRTDLHPILIDDDPLDLAPGATVAFTNGTATARLEGPLIKAAMLELAEAQPRAVAFGQVLEAARERSGLSGPDDAATLALALRSLAAADAVRLGRLVPAWPQRGGDVGERPTAPPLVRHHLSLGARSIPSLALHLVDVDEVDARLLAVCDGTRDRAALVEAWSEHVDGATPAALEERLDALAQAALLLA